MTRCLATCHREMEIQPRAIWTGGYAESSPSGRRHLYCLIISIAAVVLSADGHQWTDEAYVTDYLEKSFGDFTRSYPYDGDDALAYASSGFIWDNVLKHGLTFRDYGEFVNAVIEPAGCHIYRNISGFHERSR